MKSANNGATKANLQRRKDEVAGLLRKNFLLDWLEATATIQSSM